jgi:hypothetical protein
MRAPALDCFKPDRASVADYRVTVALATHLGMNPGNCRLGTLNHELRVRMLTDHPIH